MELQRRCNTLIMLIEKVGTRTTGTVPDRTPYNFLIFLAQLFTYYRTLLFVGSVQLEPLEGSIAYKKLQLADLIFQVSFTLNFQ